MPPFKDPPKDFQELMERAPTMVSNIVKNFLRFNNSLPDGESYTSFEADFDEYLQETYLWLLHIPPGVHKERGCTDRIQTYDGLCPPNLSRWQHFKVFMVMIINRFLQTHRTQRHLDAMERGTRSLGAAPSVVVDPTHKVLIDECVHGLSGYVTNGKPRKKEFQILATRFGFTTPHERERFRSRVNRYVEHHFSRHFEY